MSYFRKDAPLNERDSLLLDEIQSLPKDKQQDAIAMLFGAFVSEYESSSEEQRENMNPFVRFFAEMAIVKDAETQKPQQSMTDAACVSVKISTSNELLAGGSNVNQ